ncbi:MAG TPA: HAD family hydrolase [Gammaproteobacteria bacterium]|nr:HAD family hydrolase [Gammaproteobacteria bacterium]
MSSLTTLLFDVDGTLAETEETHRQSFNKAFQQAGLDWEWSPELYSELLKVTGGKERIRHFLETRLPEFEPPMNLDEYIAGLHAAKTDIYTSTVASGQMPIRPGVRRVLEEARRAGLRLAIATTTTPANVASLLQYNFAPDAEDWFEVIGAGAVVPEKKPAPDIYHYVMEKLGVEPAECLAFEDSENGLRSALAAGLRTLVTTSQYTGDQNFEGAVLVLDHLGEPDRPFRVLSGDAGDHDYTTVDLLRELHGRSQSQ